MKLAGMICWNNNSDRYKKMSKLAMKLGETRVLIITLSGDYDKSWTN